MLLNHWEIMLVGKGSLMCSHVYTALGFSASRPSLWGKKDVMKFDKIKGSLSKVLDHHKLSENVSGTVLEEQTPFFQK